MTNPKPTTIQADSSVAQILSDLSDQGRTLQVWMNKRRNELLPENTAVSRVILDAPPPPPPEHGTFLSEEFLRNQYLKAVATGPDPMTTDTLKDELETAVSDLEEQVYVASRFFSRWQIPLDVHSQGSAPAPSVVDYHLAAVQQCATSLRECANNASYQYIKPTIESIVESANSIRSDLVSYDIDSAAAKMKVFEEKHRQATQKIDFVTLQGLITAYKDRLGAAITIRDVDSTVDVKSRFERDYAIGNNSSIRKEYDACKGAIENDPQGASTNLTHNRLHAAILVEVTAARDDFEYLKVPLAETDQETFEGTCESARFSLEGLKSLKLTGPLGTLFGEFVKDKTEALKTVEDNGNDYWQLQIASDKSTGTA